MRPRYLPPSLRTGSEEMSVCRDIFASAGGVCYSTSDSRATRSTPGLSDLLVVFPGPRILLAWDAKAGSEQYRPTDVRRLSLEQKVFGDLLARGLTTAFGWGDADAARGWLMTRRGLA